jgi:hypothetical protein
MVLLMGFAPPQPLPTRAEWEPAKLDFASLSASQMRALWKRADDYALAEALLKQCGSPSHIEQRMMSAAKACVEPRALEGAVAYFRKKVAGLGTNPRFLCSSYRSKALMKIMRSKIDRVVEDVRARCSACVFC